MRNKNKFITQFVVILADHSLNIHADEYRIQFIFTIKFSFLSHSQHNTSL